jgi:hypothetical protein
MVVEPGIPETHIADAAQRTTSASASASASASTEETGAEPKIHIAGSSDAEPNIPIVDLSALSALRLPAEPGLLALRLPSGRPSEGLYDGAWWPHSRDIHAVLPGLVAALTEHLHPIDRIGLDADAWDGLGTPLYVDGRHVVIDWFPVGDDTILIPLGDLGTCSLLAIAPDAGVDEADAAMTMTTGLGGSVAKDAEDDDDDEDEDELLVVTTVIRPA